MTQKRNKYYSQVWRSYLNIKSVLYDEPYEGTVEWSITQDVQYALYLYWCCVRHPKNWLLIPEGLKFLAENTNETLITVLSKSLRQYVQWAEKYSVCDPTLSYASITDIKSYKFAYPQLIPDEKGDLEKYYTRVSKALLHIFSYPGSIICRCETDAEHNASLFLYSLFDWFGVLQYGSSIDEMVNSLRIFKRTRHHQWTKDGLLPVVLFPQPVQPLDKSKQKAVEWTLENGQTWVRPITEALIPVISAVEPTLELLLAYAISEWSKQRNSDLTPMGKFVVPDWLFIHGIMYNALHMTLYAFRPRLLEFDDEGVPSKWEFAAIMIESYECCPFSTRHLYERATSTFALLAVQRHTKRICEILNSLDLTPDMAIFAPELNIFPGPDGIICVEDETNGVKCAADVQDEIGVADVQNGLAETATQCLKDCIRRTGLDLPYPTTNNWSFLSSPTGLASHPSNRFIDDFRNNWQTQNAGKLLLPEEWLTTVLNFEDHEFVTTWEFFKLSSRSQLQMWTSGWKDNFDVLTEEELAKRHLDPHSFSPDFYLSTPARRERVYVHEEPPLEHLRPDTNHSLEHFKDAYQYVSHEFDAKLAVSSPFMCTPGCWLKYDTESRFPSGLSTASLPSVDFSLLLHCVQTVPIPMTPLTPDVNLRATILNPALVVAIQGPATWPDEYASSPASQTFRPRPKDKVEALRQLEQAIEPSLKTHLINWQLRFEQGFVSTIDLPPWFMLFGIVYDAEEVTIVAHIPYKSSDDSQYTFISCVVDTIPFPPVVGTSKITEPWLLNRFRVGLALMSLQKHAFQMAGLWDCVVWPNELVSWEEIVEREYLGPALAPSERGYMIPPPAMALLYREMRGSDETLVDHSGNVSELEDESGEGEMEDEKSEEEDSDE